MQGKDVIGKKRLKVTEQENSESSDTGPIAILDDDDIEDEDIPIAALTRRKKKAEAKGSSASKLGHSTVPSNGESSESIDAKVKKQVKARKSIKKE